MVKVDEGSRETRRHASSAGAVAAFVLAVAVLVAGVAYTVAGTRDHPSDRVAVAHTAQVMAPDQAATLAAATAPVTAPAGPVTQPQRHVDRAAGRQSTRGAQPMTPRAAGARLTTSHKAPARDAALVPKQTFLAVLVHRTKGYATAHARKPKLIVPKGWYGRTSVLPILRATAKRVKVRLPRRPNESKVWIKRSAVTFSITPYALVIDLSRRHIYVFRHGKQKGGYPIGEGTRRTPTPTGKYFVAFHAPPNGPQYGTVMLETSAHSEVFRTFGGGNDAIIAIHGPIYSDARIANHGARISNGCIRMHERQLVKVAKVIDGSPLFIVH
jgi:hypothetical protein